jgi:hypothetical protein
VADFTRGLGLPPSTVSGWFDRDAPHTPDVAQLIKIARRSNVSLDWLLLGVPPEYLGPIQPGERIRSRFRQAVVTELLDRGVATHQEIEGLVPDADQLLEAAVNRYDELVRERLPLLRDLAHLKKETEGWMIYSVEGEVSPRGIRRRIHDDLRSRRKVVDSVAEKMKTLKNSASTRTRDNKGP